MNVRNFTRQPPQSQRHAQEHENKRFLKNLRAGLIDPRKTRGTDGPTEQMPRQAGSPLSYIEELGPGPNLDINRLLSRDLAKTALRILVSLTLFSTVCSPKTMNQG